MGKQRRRAVRLAAQKRREVAEDTAAKLIVEAKAAVAAAELSAKLIAEAKKEEEKRRIASRSRSKKTEKSGRPTKEEPVIKSSTDLKSSRFKKENKKE